MPQTVTIHVAKTTLSRLVARVEAGEEIVIARDKTPVAKLVPIAPPKPKRAPGSMKARIALDPSFFEPLPEDELGRWEQALRILLDTHIFIWWLTDDRALSARARRAIADEANEVFVSAASAWEIATKYRLGKLPGAAALALDVAGAVASQGFAPLPIAIAHAALAGPHRDPFARMLIAQAMLDDLVLISNDTAFDAYGVRRLW